MTDTRIFEHWRTSSGPLRIYSGATSSRTSMDESSYRFLSSDALSAFWSPPKPTSIRLPRIRPRKPRGTRHQLPLRAAGKPFYNISRLTLGMPSLAEASQISQQPCPGFGCQGSGRRSTVFTITSLSRTLTALLCSTWWLRALPGSPPIHDLQQLPTWTNPPAGLKPLYRHPKSRFHHQSSPRHIPPHELHRRLTDT